MKFRNKETGVVVEPASALAAQTFERNSEVWERTDAASTPKISKKSGGKAADQAGSTGGTDGGGAT